MTDCHNHQSCIDDALVAAQTICKEHGARLTELRQQVFLLIWQSHKPLGAYALMDMLAEESQRRVAPPTVYRALEFLLSLGLVHRINSLNAYIGCSSPEAHQKPSTVVNQGINYFFICNQCHDTKEVIDAALAKKITAAGQKLHFSAQQQWLEVTGLCQQCQ
ncbi:MAG: Fur family transcriptional regulator [Cellvibrionaceae bacterium]